MRFVFGIIVGVLITIGAAYIHDPWTTSPDRSDSDQQSMVNWDVFNRNVNALGSNIEAGWVKLTGQIHDKT